MKFVVLFGPPAVGKMTVGYAPEKLTGLSVSSTTERRRPATSQEPSKRNLEWTRQNVLRTDEKYRMNSHGDFFYPAQHQRVENTDLSPEEVARRITERFNIPLC